MNVRVKFCGKLNEIRLTMYLFRGSVSFIVVVVVVALIKRPFSRRGRKRQKNENT